ncbi:hypothetical protein BDV95DRAFT_331332 [Massariosphaeria phaeospora]|uniref:Uncharacterized protein n=1 Tax=Massariosphaeria phaeospora TaxID=100035 RepID=A0A7C8IEM5_9PLEO|nr:hypothetical protein BDV95DRAFT_331332 [Massariosphaeria phaeospora]
MTNPLKRKMADGAASSATVSASASKSASSSPELSTTAAILLPNLQHWLNLTVALRFSSANITRRSDPQIKPTLQAIQPGLMRKAPHLPSSTAQKLLFAAAHAHLAPSASPSASPTLSSRAESILENDPLSPLSLSNSARASDATIIEDPAQRQFIAERLSALLNLGRRNSVDPTITPENVLEITPFSAAHALRIFDEYSASQHYEINPDAVRALFRNPRTSLETVEVERPFLCDGIHDAPDGESSSSGTTKHPSSQNDADDEKQDEDEADPLALAQAYDSPESPSSDSRGASKHPTGQHLKDHESWLFDKATGKWFVRFAYTLPNGTVYEQIDEMPVFQPDAASPELTPDETDKVNSMSYIAHTGKLLTFSRKDPGHWEVVENDTSASARLEKTLREQNSAGDDDDKASTAYIHGNTYTRIYPTRKPRDTSREGALATPLFIARKFHRTTHQYLHRYKFGLSYPSFVANILSWDMNSFARVQDYNRWIQQVVERADFRYTKRASRACWSKAELQALRAHFNGVIDAGGLVAAQTTPEWSEAVRKVNAVKGEGGKRNENGVASQAERDWYWNGDERMGVHEWRLLGEDLARLQMQHPGLVISDCVLRPRNPDDVEGPRCPIAMDDVVAKEAGGNMVAEERKKGKLPARKREVRQVKMWPEVVGGKLVMKDRFSGELLRKFGMDGGGGEEKGTAVASSSSTSTSTSSSEPSPKRRKLSHK